MSISSLRKKLRKGLGSMLALSTICMSNNGRVYAMDQFDGEFPTVQRTGTRTCHENDTFAKAYDGLSTEYYCAKGLMSEGNKHPFIIHVKGLGKNDIGKDAVLYEECETGFGSDENIPLDTVIEWLIGLLDGLIYLEEKLGALHFDMETHRTNILMAWRGNGFLPVLSDFDKEAISTGICGKKNSGKAMSQYCFAWLKKNGYTCSQKNLKNQCSSFISTQPLSHAAGKLLAIFEEFFVESNAIIFDENDAENFEKFKDILGEKYNTSPERLKNRLADLLKDGKVYLKKLKAFHNPDPITYDDFRYLFGD